MNRRPTSVRLNGWLLAASIILLAATLATGHVRGAIYATVATVAFGSLLAVGIRENRANRPQVPLDARPPLCRRVLAGLLGVNLTRGEHPRAYRHHDHNHADQ